MAEVHLRIHVNKSEYVDAPTMLASKLENSLFACNSV